MAFWLASKRQGQDSDWIQRFDPRFWTVNFPRPMMAAVTVTAPDAVRIDATFLTAGDLAGVIWESEDRFDHPLLAYDANRDYARCSLSFRWRSGGMPGLDAVNGPTLTIEGRDATGAPRTWYVRLWNYATSGSPTDASIRIEFSDLAGGFILPAEADPVHPSAIDRMFISLVPPGFTPGAAAPLPAPVDAWAELSQIRCDGEHSMLEVGDVMVPPHGQCCATAYDDNCNLTPTRVLRNVEGLGYRGRLLHYVGMSHYLRLRAAGDRFLIDAEGPAFCGPAEAWHANFLVEARTRGFEPVLSLSYECLAEHCPDAWQQRAADGSPARTGWVPPSALLSPASEPAMAWLRKIARKLSDLMRQAGAPIRVQIGEPWWWTDAQGRIYLYDDAACAALGGAPPDIPTLRAELGPTRTALLDAAGAILAASTIGLRDAVRSEAGAAGAEVSLLTFLPTVLDPAMPDAARANLPTGWSAPAFDRLQLEDYDWLTSGTDGPRRRAYDLAAARLGYSAGQTDYLAGFVPQASSADLWRRIDAGIDEALARGVGNVFVWALPQICRDGFVRLPGATEDENMQAFDDIQYPLPLGQNASVTPEFTTTVAVTASGFEHRNSLWRDARLRYDVGPGIRSDNDLATLLGFFRARRGAARGFRLRDPYDCSSNGMTGTPTAQDQLLGMGNGVATSFPLLKRYGATSDAQVRRITRPVPGSVRVSVDGVLTTEGWTLGAHGVVGFLQAPPAGAVIKAGFLFDVPVRFAEDQLHVSGSTFAAGDAPSVPLVEVREAA